MKATIQPNYFHLKYSVLYRIQCNDMFHITFPCLIIMANSKTCYLLSSETLMKTAKKKKHIEEMKRIENLYSLISCLRGFRFFLCHNDEELFLCIHPFLCIYYGNQEFLFSPKKNNEQRVLLLVFRCFSCFLLKDKWKRCTRPHMQ